MKRFLILSILLLGLICAGCSANKGVSALQTAQDDATKLVLALGAAFQSTPAIVDALYTSGKISKDTRNEIVEPYNQGLASYAVLNKALQTCIKSGINPQNDSVYLAAYLAFITDKNNLDNLIKALGGTLK